MTLCIPPRDFIQIGVDVFPTTAPPKPQKMHIPLKLLMIMRKYKFPWRINQLAKPMRKVRKFVPMPVTLLKAERPKGPKISAESAYYADQMSRPPLRLTVCNKRLYGRQNGRKYRKFINRNIRRAWDSIYNYYKKKERDRRLRQLKRDSLKAKPKKQPDLARYDELATPKPVFKPPPVKNPHKGKFTNFQRLDVIATPKTYYDTSGRELGKVEASALRYEPTEIVYRLAKIPDRFKNIPKPIDPGKVKRSALRYKATPRTETLAQPKQRREKVEEDDFDPFQISKNALKYKPTPRILELAKPKEYD
ncbi:unnamed protein product [Acanthoscelides obtectus]|uniref:Testicular haploid expressed protein n=1 Tax=Acanthoscelides obtectus TaxID=200917 RepID=A0A9P0KG20_ACAOB|nr:unnamed protein product [Acanthoscelides obtectus]CAK1654538.1 hypothetical protein AOBTE_LOCUS18662 [Acanthoscelides obtectus]